MNTTTLLINSYLLIWFKYIPETWL